MRFWVTLPILALVLWPSVQVVWRTIGSLTLKVSLYLTPRGVPGHIEPQIGPNCNRPAY